MPCLKQVKRLYQAVILSSTVVRECRFLVDANHWYSYAAHRSRHQLVTDQAYIPVHKGAGFYARLINLSLQRNVRRYQIFTCLGFGQFFAFLHILQLFHHYLLIGFESNLSARNSRAIQFPLLSRTSRTMKPNWNYFR
jgi:hypothetical protein